MACWALVGAKRLLLHRRRRLRAVSRDRLTSSCSGRCKRYRGAAHARHFIMRVRRATTVSAPPLNCGVSRQVHRCTPNLKSAVFTRSQVRSRVVRQVCRWSRA